MSKYSTGGKISGPNQNFLANLNCVQSVSTRGGRPTLITTVSLTPKKFVSRFQKGTKSIIGCRCSCLSQAFVIGRLAPIFGRKAATRSTATTTTIAHSGVPPLAVQIPAVI